jgi:hypothetical protein
MKHSGIYLEGPSLTTQFLISGRWCRDLNPKTSGHEAGLLIINVPEYPDDGNDDNDW